MKLCPLCLTLCPSLFAAHCDPWWQLLSTRSHSVPCPMSRTQPFPNVVLHDARSHEDIHSLQCTNVHTYAHTVHIPCLSIWNALWWCKAVSLLCGHWETDSWLKASRSCLRLVFHLYWTIWHILYLPVVLSFYLFQINKLRSINCTTNKNSSMRVAFY